MINFFAIFTIVKFRIREFLYEYNYSILAPLISNLLFVIIFSTIDRYYSLSFGTITFIEMPLQTIRPKSLVLPVCLYGSSNSVKYSTALSKTKLLKVSQPFGKRLIWYSTK